MDIPHILLLCNDSPLAICGNNMEEAVPRTQKMISKDRGEGEGGDRSRPKVLWTSRCSQPVCVGGDPDESGTDAWGVEVMLPTAAIDVSVGGAPELQMTLLVMQSSFGVYRAMGTLKNPT
eukprot:scaffold6204_cov55-Attheya_sp.AAC.4